MNNRVKKKHEKMFQKKIESLQKEGYIVNKHDGFFKSFFSMGMGDLEIITKSGDVYLCRYGYNPNNILGFCDRKSSKFIEINEVLGFKKAKQIVEKKVDIIPIKFNIVERIRNNKDGDLYDFCEMTDEGYLIFGFKNKDEEKRFVGPTWYEIHGTYKDNIKKILDIYAERDEEFYNAILNLMDRHNVTLDSLTNNKYGNTRKS